MTVIDIHTHMISEAWVEQIREHGGAALSVGRRPDGIEALIENGSMTMPLIPEMFDPELRMRDMDKDGIDIAVLSLTSPNVYWGGEEVSTETARIINDCMAETQTAYPDRIRYIAALPFQYPDAAVAELARACGNGAVGVMVLATIDGRPLTDPRFEPVWEAIDKRALPVFLHPSNPPGADSMDLGPLRLLPTVGFTFDTTLAITRMVLDGFFDRFPNLDLIAAHGGGVLPFIASRIDLFFEHTMPSQKKIDRKPSDYLRRIYYDAVLYDSATLAMCMDLGGSDRVMFGTDYPHATDVPGILGRIRDLPGDQRDAVLTGNAARLFGL